MATEIPDQYKNKNIFMTNIFQEYFLSAKERADMAQNEILPASSGFSQ